jgi:hypothetical protein
MRTAANASAHERTAQSDAIVRGVTAGAGAPLLHEVPAQPVGATGDPCTTRPVVLPWSGPPASSVCDMKAPVDVTAMSSTRQERHQNGTSRGYPPCSGIGWRVLALPDRCRDRDYRLMTQQMQKGCPAGSA